MAKAIFLDRDGTLNEDNGYVHKVENLKILPGVIEGLRLLQKDYLFFIITNQSGIARKYYNEKDFLKFNNHLLEKLALEDIRIERTYFCPHLSSCDCRKPSTKFIEEIVKEFDINLIYSWVIGDHPSDILMGIKAGCKTAYLLTGHGIKHISELEKNSIKPTIIEEDFLKAAQKIKND